MAAIDRIDLADDWVAQIADFATATGAVWTIATAQHGRALLDDGSEAGASSTRRGRRVPSDACSRAAPRRIW